MANRDFFRRLGLADEIAAPTLARLRQPKTLRRLLLVALPLIFLLRRAKAQPGEAAILE